VAECGQLGTVSSQEKYFKPLSPVESSRLYQS
jgi:hypothetical protein